MAGSTTSDQYTAFQEVLIEIENEPKVVRISIWHLFGRASITHRLIIPSPPVALLVIRLDNRPGLRGEEPLTSQVGTHPPIRLNLFGYVAIQSFGLSSEDSAETKVHVYNGTSPLCRELSVISMVKLSSISTCSIVTFLASSLLSVCSVSRSIFQFSQHTYKSTTLAIHCKRLHPSH